MEFFKCSIGGEVYGTGITEIERGGAQRNGLKIDEVWSLLIWQNNIFIGYLFLFILSNLSQVKISAASMHEKGFNFDDARLMHGAWRNERNPEFCKVHCLMQPNRMAFVLT